MRSTTPPSSPLPSPAAEESGGGALVAAASRGKHATVAAVWKEYGYPVEGRDVQVLRRLGVGRRDHRRHRVVAWRHRRTRSCLCMGENLNRAQNSLPMQPALSSNAPTSRSATAPQANPSPIRLLTWWRCRFLHSPVICPIRSPMPQTRRRNVVDLAEVPAAAQGGRRSR